MFFTGRLTAASLLGALVMLSGLAQQAPRTATSHRQAYFGPNEVHIDEDCRIHPDPALVLPGAKAAPYSDPAICHLESVHSSQHIEQKIQDHRLYRSRVEVHEHEFVVVNIADTPVIFVVQQNVPAGWVIDSDPAPQQMIGRTAYFPLHVDPGQSVRLHVGMRHTRALRTEAF